MYEIKIEMRTSADYNKILSSDYNLGVDFLTAISELVKSNNIDLEFEEILELKVMTDEGIIIEEYNGLELMLINQDIKEMIKEGE